MSSGQERPRKESKEVLDPHEGQHTPPGYVRHYRAEGPGVEKPAPIVDYQTIKRPEDPDWVPEAADLPDEEEPGQSAEAGSKQQEGKGGGLGGEQKNM
jgi:hypothetical protein